MFERTSIIPYLPANQPGCLHTCLRTCMHARLPASEPVYACLPACAYLCMPAPAHACLHVRACMLVTCAAAFNCYSEKFIPEHTAVCEGEWVEAANQPICLPACPPTLCVCDLWVFTAVCVYVCPSACPSVCLSVHPSVAHFSRNLFFFKIA